MDWVLPLIIGLLAWLALRALLQSGPKVAPRDAAAAVAAGKAVLVDVREPPEWRHGVAGPAHLLAMSDLRVGRRQWDPFLRQHRGKQFLLYCASGTRSAMAARLLRSQGHEAANVGSFSAWRRAGLPVRRP